MCCCQVKSRSTWRGGPEGEQGFSLLNISLATGHPHSSKGGEAKEGRLASLDRRGSSFPRSAWPASTKEAMTARPKKAPAINATMSQYQLTIPHLSLIRVVRLFCPTDLYCTLCNPKTQRRRQKTDSFSGSISLPLRRSYTLHGSVISGQPSHARDERKSA